MRKSFVLLILLCSFACSGSGSNSNTTPATISPITTQGTDFVRNGSTLNFVGAFTFPSLTHYVYESWREDWQSDIDTYLDSLSAAGISVIRFFGFGEYQISLSGSNEPNWERLDYLISKCEEKEIYIIFNLWDYWDYAGGQATDDHDEVTEFWNDASITEAMESMVTRYTDRDIIFSWELINEGDAQTIREYYDDLLAWVTTEAAAIKAIDPNHLLSTGFTQEALRETYYDDPDSYETVRDRIIEINSLSTIDYLSFHSYGGNVDLMTDASWYNDEWHTEMTWYINETLAIQQEIGKPMIHGEWGAQQQVGEEARLAVYDFMLNTFGTNAINNTFNGWGDDEEPESMLIYSDDTDFLSLIQEENHF